MELDRANGTEVGGDQGAIALQNGRGTATIVVCAFIGMSKYGQASAIRVERTWCRQERPHVGGILVSSKNHHGIVRGAATVDPEDLHV